MDITARRDLLTRTTLRLASCPAPSAIEQLTHALQHVTGVLTVDVDAGSASASVAHDAAVPLTSLIAAASLAGVAAKVAGGLPASAATTPLPKRTGQSHLRSIGIGAILAVIAIDPTSIGTRRSVG